MSYIPLIQADDFTDGDVEIELTEPQYKFTLAPEKYPLFVAGFGAGKSKCMVICLLNDLLNFPGANVAAYCPTYDLLSLITVPYIEEHLELLEIRYTHNKSRNIIEVKGHGKIILRSMDNPNRIVGYQVFRSHVDEIDTMRQSQAEMAWNKIIARNRQKIYRTDDTGNFLPNSNFGNLIVDAGSGQTRKDIDPYLIETNRVSAYTTPEGYVFAYDRWVKRGGPLYGLYKASTFSNPHNPPDYVDSLRATYPAQLIEAYLNGDFVNLTSGAVYPKFDRTLNGTQETVQANEPLEVGMDFNVLKGAASIHVRRGPDNDPHCVDEIHNAYDTDEQVAYLKQTYPRNPITVYPDATGDRRQSANTTRSDIKKLQAANFSVKFDRSNPAIKDRVNAVNAKILNGKGHRSYFVNVDTCPNLVASLEQQIWGDNGQPDKAAGLDHMTDGAGYFVIKNWPLHKPDTTTVVTTGRF